MIPENIVWVGSCPCQHFSGTPLPTMPIWRMPIWRMPGSQLCCLIGRNRTARKRFALMQAEAWPMFRYTAPAPRHDPIAAKRYKREQRKSKS